MCLDCLNSNLEGLSGYRAELTETLENRRDCDCGCKGYYEFLIGVSDDLKILCDVNIKLCGVCDDKNKVNKFKGMVKSRIKNKLNTVLENLDNLKEEISDGEYLHKMNELKELNDYVQKIEEGYHR